MSSLDEKKKTLLEDLRLFPDPLARLDYLIDEARAMEALPADQCIEPNRIEGCMSNLWFLAERREGRCFFRCQADSLVVKSIAGLLCRFYSDATPADILANDPTFLREAGLTDHLSTNRRNTLTQIWERIKAFAESAQ